MPLLLRALSTELKQNESWISFRFTVFMIVSIIVYVELGKIISGKPIVKFGENHSGKKMGTLFCEQLYHAYTSVP